MQRVLRRSKKVERSQKGQMGSGKKELRRMIGEMREKLMERFSEKMGKLKLEIRQRERECREKR